MMTTTTTNTHTHTHIRQVLFSQKKKRAFQKKHTDFLLYNIVQNHVFQNKTKNDDKKHEK